MARLRPSTLDKFRSVKGVGEKKLTDYGQDFIEAINKYCQQQQLSQDVAPILTAQRPPARTSVNASSVAAFAFFRQGASIKDVAERMNRAHSTVAGYLSDFLKHDKIVDPSPWVRSDVAQRIEQAIQQVGGQRLQPIHEHLGGEIDYGEIRIVATCRNNREQ
jgi:ATP-dependent DNA helicase RecQ